MSDAEQRELPDAAERHAIEFRLDSTLFVEAGAGSGKTTALVSRIMQLLRSGACELEALAAITFTEAAALELKVRLREALGELAAEGASAVERDRARRALEHLEEAAISTIHGFCQRLLADFPLEAGLPPRLEILDEVRQSLAWPEYWSSLLDDLGEDEGIRRLLGLAALIGVRPAHLEDLAREVSQEWDHCGRVGPDVDAVLEKAAAAVEEGTEKVLTSLDRALELEGCCTEPGDRLLERLRGAGELRRLLTSPGETGPGDRVAPDPDGRLALLAADQPCLRAANLGQRGSWGCAVEEVRRHLNDAAAAREQVVATVAAIVLPAVVATFDLAARQAAEARRQAGTLTFHDLLVFARDLLGGNPGVLEAVRRRLRFLLIDEFQDTDPLQLEIAELIGAGPPGPGASEGAGARSRGVEAGRLFFVGDPKQSIYRFRGADLQAYEAARERLAGGRPVTLSSNFRSVPGILAFANECVAALMADDCAPLDTVRPDGGTGAAVWLVGGPLDRSLKRHDQRVVESEACAAMIHRAVRAEGWLVGDGEHSRPARMSDVAVLVPRRTGLAELEEALDTHGIGYRVESASLIYRSQEVRDLLSLCRAIDDPVDEVALVATLRSPAFACRDDELYAFRQGGGRWSVEASSPPGAAAGPVAGALEVLRSLRRRRFELGPVGVLEAAVDDRRLLQLAVGSPHMRESWRRVRFLLERARAFVEGGGGGLREFADWVDEQLSEGLRPVESVLPEPDEDVVHVLTVHAAKGLEYPIVVLAGFGTTDDVPRGGGGRKVLRAPGDRIEVRLRNGLSTEGYEELRSAEQVLDRAEAVRVLYVAATRARDRLVVCTHHVPVLSGEGTLGQRLHEAALPRLEVHPGLWRFEETPTPEGAERLEGAVTPSFFEVASLAAGAGRLPGRRSRLASSPEDWHRWQRERQGLLAAARRRRSVRATEVASLAGLKWAPAGEAAPAAEALLQPDGLESAVAAEGAGAGGGGGGEAGAGEARRRGRAGTQLGRAVHATLQAIGLEAAREAALGLRPVPELARLAATQARAEHLGRRAAEVEALAAAALASPSVRAAFASGRPRREIYVATTVAGIVLDGYVDLCFEEAGGLTVVDYKTDTVGGEAEVEAMAERYGLQAAAYALALGDVTGRAVRRCVLVFVSAPGRPIELEVPDLDGAVQRVRAVVESAA